MVFWKRGEIKNTTALSLVSTVVVAVGVFQYATFGLDIAKTQEKRKPTAAAINKIVPANQTLYIFKPGSFLNPVIFDLQTPLAFIYDTNDINDGVNYLLIKKADLEAVET